MPVVHATQNSCAAAESRPLRTRRRRIAERAVVSGVARRSRGVHGAFGRSAARGTGSSRDPVKAFGCIGAADSRRNSLWRMGRAGTLRVDAARLALSRPYADGI